MITPAEARGEVVRIEVRITPRQALRLEQFCCVLGINKSKMTDIALDDLFNLGQKEVMRKVQHRRGGR